MPDDAVASYAMATGMDLRLERTAARVKLMDLAARMGKDPATLNRWEGRGAIDDARAAEYRAALASLATEASPASAATEAA